MNRGKIKLPVEIISRLRDCGSWLAGSYVLILSGLTCADYTFFTSFEEVARLLKTKGSGAVYRALRGLEQAGLAQVSRENGAVRIILNCGQKDFSPRPPLTTLCFKSLKAKDTAQLGAHNARRGAYACVNINRVNEKKVYGEFLNVFLTHEDLNRLKELYEEDDINRAIEKLSAYKQSKKKKYKDDRAALLVWVFDSLGAKKRGETVSAVGWKEEQSKREQALKQLSGER